MGKRSDILAAALKIAAQDGIHALTMARIQNEASVGSGTMYNYFDSKETLLRALYEDAMVRMNREVLTGYTLTGDVRRDFEALLARFLDYSIEYFDQFNFTNQYAFVIGGVPTTSGAEDLDRLFALSRQIAAAGQAEGTVKDADPALLQRIVAGIIVAVAESFYLGDFAPTAQLKQIVITSCWHAVRAQ
jgi:AcrR family transcriptional regulator